MISRIINFFRKLFKRHPRVKIEFLADSGEWVDITKDVVDFKIERFPDVDMTRWGGS